MMRHFQHLYSSEKKTLTYLKQSVICNYNGTLQRKYDTCLGMMHNIGAVIISQTCMQHNNNELYWVHPINISIDIKWLGKELEVLNDKGVAQ